MRGSFLALLVLAASLGNTIAAPTAVTGAAVVRRDRHAPALRSLTYAKRGNNNGDGGPGGNFDCANGGHGGNHNGGGSKIQYD